MGDLPLSPVAEGELGNVQPQSGNFFMQLLISVWQTVGNLADSVFGRLQNLIGIKGMAYFFVLPNLLIFGIFILFPMLLNFTYAVTDGTHIFLDERPYVGEQNFEALFNCENFFEPNSCSEDLFPRAVVNTAFFVVTQVGLMVIVAVITALALNRPIRMRGFFRGVFFFPVLLSPIVVALIWKWILQENGLLNALLIGIGLDKQPFLINGDWARFWVVIISVWSLMGFYTLILLAGLQSIPADLYEAASIDGAGSWQSFWRITLPLLMPTLLVVLILSLIRAVQVFDVVFAFTGGGPGTATQYMVQYIYNNGFAAPIKRYGIASAASLIMAIVLVVSTMIQFRLQGGEDDKKPPPTRFPAWTDTLSLGFAGLPFLWLVLGFFSPELFAVLFGIVVLILSAINLSVLRRSQGSQRWQRAAVIIVSVALAFIQINSGLV